MIGKHIDLHTLAGFAKVSYITGHGKSGIILRKPQVGDSLYVRVHSSCVFSESLGSGECDCADQLRISLDVIGTNGGILIYVYDEGRGVGLESKIEAISLQQEHGIDTAAAFKELGFKPDMRGYELAAAVLKEEIGDQPFVLLTNNPAKLNGLSAHGLKISRTQKVVSNRPDVQSYMKEKTEALGHEFA